MNKEIRFFLFLFLLSFSEIIPQGYITFNHLTVEDGLSQSSVTCIFQDKKGFMWFGTQDGLNRYDGYNFKVFKNNPADSNSLSDNFILSIYEDKKGILYVETQSGKFHKYDPAAESFSAAAKDKIDLTDAGFTSVNAICEEPGARWTGGLSKSIGLTKEDKKTGLTVHYKHNPSDPASISDDKVYSVFRDHNGNLWVGTFNGLDKLDEKTGKFSHYKNDHGNPYSLPDNWVWPIYEDVQGNLWIGTPRSGLSLFDPASNRFYNYKNNPGDPASLSDNFIYSVYQDRSGVIWIGTNAGGINYFHPSTLAFEHYRHNQADKNSLSDDNVTSILVDKKGIYWVGTGNGGLNKFNFKEKKFTNYYHDASKTNSLISNSVYALLEDIHGKIWVGTLNSGLDVFDPNTGKFTHYIHNPSDPFSLTDNRVYSLLEDKDSNIWIGTYGGGLNKFDRKSGKIFSYQFGKNDSSSISSNAAWTIAQDGTGKLWIGTFGGGVNVFDEKLQTFSHFKHFPDDSTSICDENIIRVFKDSKGNMWFGTTKGLSEYLWNSRNFKNYTEEDGLANNTVYGIAEDSKGNLWLSTNNGLSKFNPASRKFKNYYYENGLQGNEFNQNAFSKDELTGRLLFGGPNGLNVFNPDKISGNNFIPPVAFTNYLRYNTGDEEGKPIIEKGITVSDSISLTYKDNIVILEFSALSFFNNKQNQYRYKLAGFNENWIQLGKNHSVTFTNLSPGNYNLKVTGSNNEGLWNENGADLSIKVFPPWWRTNIAYAFYGISVLGFLYGIRRFEINRREQKAKMRENELRLKATEAEKRAVEIENERKTKELEEARQLQLSMLPKELPKLPDLEIAAFMRTATEVGGDYYDFIINNDTLNIAFGDATGHGLQAGTMVTLMKGFFTSDAARLDVPGFMNHCNHMIKEIKIGRILMSFCFLRIVKHKLVFANAGMPPVYYFNNCTQNTEEIIIQGMPLGAIRKSDYKISELNLNSGDAVLLISDGLPEQMNRNKEMFDYSRVKECFNKFAKDKPENIIANMMKYGDEWMDGAAQSDDISFVVLKAV